MGLKALGLVWAPSKHSVNVTSQYYRPVAVAVDAAGGGRRPTWGMLLSGVLFGGQVFIFKAALDPVVP